MSITISVTAKCEGMTQKGLKCRKDATVYEPANFPSSIVPAKFYSTYQDQHNIIPTGFRCDTHSREGHARMWSRIHRNYRS